MSGTYFIICTPTSKIYVGSSANVSIRIEQHFAKLRLGKHQNPKLQAAFNKYGREAFVAGLLEPAEISDCLAVEQQFLNSGVAEFNIAPCATCPPSMRGKRFSPEH